MHSRVKCMKQCMQQLGCTRLQMICCTQISDAHIKSELQTCLHSTGVHGRAGHVVWLWTCCTGTRLVSCVSSLLKMWCKRDVWLRADISARYQKAWPLFPPSTSSSEGFKDLEAQANHEMVWFWWQIQTSVGWFIESLKNHRFGFFQYSKIKEPPVPLLWKN